MTFDDWSPSARIETAYRDAMRRLMARLSSFVAGLDVTDPLDILRAISGYFGTDVFREQAAAAASRMVTGLFTGNARTWREAARESMKGRTIHEALQQELAGPVGQTVRSLVRQNALLITSLPHMRVGRGRTLTEQVAEYIAEQSLAGRRSSSIAEGLARQFPRIAESRITLIARTETSKASVALTRARSEDLGLSWYVWRATKDARLRPSHRNMDRVIVGWDEPPSPEALAGVRSTLGDYHAGDCPNCRCYPEPLIRLTQVTWPCRVFWNGAIRTMTRSRFAGISGMSARSSEERAREVRHAA